MKPKDEVWLEERVVLNVQVSHYYQLAIGVAVRGSSVVLETVRLDEGEAVGSAAVE